MLVSNRGPVCCPLQAPFQHPSPFPKGVSANKLTASFLSCCADALCGESRAVYAAGCCCWGVVLTRILPTRTEAAFEAVPALVESCIEAARWTACSGHTHSNSDNATVSDRSMRCWTEGSPQGGIAREGFLHWLGPASNCKMHSL
jgi:hypothetical protein